MANKASLGKSLLKSGKSNKKTLLVLAALAAAIGVYVVFGASAATSNQKTISWSRAKPVPYKTLDRITLYHRVKDYTVQWANNASFTNAQTIRTANTKHKLSVGPGRWYWKVMTNYCVDEPNCHTVSRFIGLHASGNFTIPPDPKPPKVKPPKDESRGGGSGTRRVTGSNNNSSSSNSNSNNSSPKTWGVLYDSNWKANIDSLDKDLSSTSITMHWQKWDVSKNPKFDHYILYRYNPRAVGHKDFPDGMTKRTTRAITVNKWKALPDHSYRFQVCAADKNGQHLACSEAEWVRTKK